jgi:glycosyltransferase involved in cell wall biosynthesis
VDLLIVTNNPERASFRQRIGAYLNFFHDNDINCEVAKLPAGSLARRKLFKQATDFDGLFLHKKRLNSLDAFWVSRYARKVIYDFDDAVMYSDKNPDSPSRKRQKSFHRTVELVDMVIAGNSYLAEHVRKSNTSVNVLPTGLDTHTYKPKVDLKNNNLHLVWIGSESTLGYLAELKPALEEIGSRFDNVVLRIICDAFFDLDNLEVEKCLWSLKKEVVDLETSDIGLAPLPDNRFTRGKCGFKILQYAAAGLPVVASPVGANTGFLVTDTRQWVDRITELIENPNLRKRMGREGLAYAEKFDMTVIGKQLVKLIKGCLANAED